VKSSVERRDFQASACDASSNAEQWRGLTPAPAGGWFMQSSPAVKGRDASSLIAVPFLGSLRVILACESTLANASEFTIARQVASWYAAPFPFILYTVSPGAL
jgi:hypothetical protein